MNLKKKRKHTPEQLAHRRRSIMHLVRHMKPFWPLYLVSATCLVLAVLLNAASPILIGRVIDDVILDKSGDSAERLKLLLMLLGGILACGIGHNVFNYLKEYIADCIGSRIGRSMRSELFDHIQRLSVGFFHKNNTGELMARIKDDIDQVWFLIGFAGILLIECVLHTVTTLICMLRISPLLTLIPLVIMACVAVIAVRMERQLDKGFDALSEENAQLTTVAQESIAGIRTVKAFSREQFEIEKFRARNSNYRRLNLDIAKVLAKNQPYISLATRILTVAVVIAGGVMYLSDHESISLGDIGAFSQYSGNIIWPMECLAWLANELAAAVASNRKIMKILDAEPEIVSPECPEKLGKVRGAVKFDRVSFGIDGKDILDDVSFSIEPGKTLGIMGLTGSGKSTVINLLERFYDVSGGTVRLDKADVRNLSLDQLRSSVAVVTQDVFLFSDSVAENISMGSRGRLSADDMKAAADAACASDFIEKLSDGYETIIGERGVGLSGGQKQRISIARALAKKAPVLVLDDATSALDMETEYRLQQSLRTLDCTKIIIAHRISAVKDADEIIVLDKGRIIERGTHQQLMQKRGQYFATYVAQYNTEDDMVPHAAGKEAVSHVS